MVVSTILWKDEVQKKVCTEKSDVNENLEENWEEKLFYLDYRKVVLLIN